LTITRRKPAEPALRRLYDDADEDSRLTGAARTLYRKIITSYNWALGYAECSDSFVASRRDISLRSVKSGRKLLLETERVSVVRKGGKRGTEAWSTRYDLSFGYRGSDEFRELNGGKHALDWTATRVTLPFDRPLRHKSQSAKSTLPKVQESPKCNISQSAKFPKVQPLHRNPISKEIDIPPPTGSAGPDGPRKGRREDGLPPGYSVWRIVHAGYTGTKGQSEDEYETLVAHLRSKRGGKFKLRCDIDSDEYGSLDDAMDIDGEPQNLIGEEVAMSTNREGQKTFMRPQPMPWRDFTILAGVPNDFGVALEVVFHDKDGDSTTTWRLPQRHVESLLEACGGEEEAVGARLRFRLMPDDSLEFAVLVAAPARLREAANDNEPEAEAA
jgi:hypothetical protein